MSQLTTLTVTNIHKTTSDASIIRFDISDVSDQYRFEAGQYLNIQANINGQKVIRSYSICSASSISKYIEIGVKKIAGGLMSNWLNDHCKVGTQLEVSKPMGNFKLLEGMEHHFFVAGGSGITPIYSMIYHLLECSESKVWLAYSNQTRESTMLLNELRNLESQYSGRLKIHWIFSRSGDQRMDVNYIANQLNAISNLTKTAVYACGPNALIQAAHDASNIVKLPSHQFVREYFTQKNAEDMQSANVGASSVEEVLNKNEKAHVQIKYEGQSFTFECGYNQKIIDAALDAGAEPPYSCMVAACCTCRAMVKKGQIEMLDSDSLSQKEIEKGFVLSCQSLPRSKSIILDFDV